jgi:hypothetical protein
MKAALPSEQRLDFLGYLVQSARYGLIVDRGGQIAGFPTQGAEFVHKRSFDQHGRHLHFPGCIAYTAPRITCV